MASPSSSSSQGDKTTMEPELDSKSSVDVSEDPTVPRDPEEKPRPPAQVQKDVTPESEKPVKLEPGTEDPVTVSEIPAFLHSPESKSKLSGKDGHPPTSGDKGGMKKEDGSQSQNIGTKLSKPTLSPPSGKKRKAEEDGTATSSSKRVQFKAPSTPGSGPKKAIPYNPRNNFREIFNKKVKTDDDEDEKYDRMEELRRRGLRHFAIGLNDCEPGLRNHYIKGASEETRRTLEKYFFEMYKFPEMFDRYSNFPLFITPSIAADMVEKGVIQSPECFICSQPFERFQRYYWKACKGHIMHYGCLVQSLQKGEEVLNGHCECAVRKR